MLVLGFALGFSTVGNAGLTVIGTDSLGNQLIYDSDFNITWYDYTPNPATTWSAANSWAQNLVISFNGTTYGGWQLPTALNQDGTGPCLGYNCTGSEMGHLYYVELGNTANAQESQVNTGPFKNLTAPVYWSGPEFANNELGSPQGYQFIMDGSQYAQLSWVIGSGIAVHPGDIGAVATPISGAAWLLGSGLFGFIGLKRKYLG